MTPQSYFQPNRFFIVRGLVIGLNVELHYTKVVLSVLNQTDIEFKSDEITVYFKNEAKREADTMISMNKSVSIIGDIVVKDNKLFLNGKIIEVFNILELAKAPKVKYINPDDIGYDGAF